MTKEVKHLTLLDGKKTSQKIRERLKKEIIKLKQRDIIPGLAVVLVGNDPASKIYVNNKKKACEKIGIYSTEYTLDKSTSQENILQLIKKLNADPKVHGILVQLPLPQHLDARTILQAIDPAKDVDAFHDINAGRMLKGSADLIPCTPAGIIKLLKEYNISISGKICTIVGRSDIVGKPLSMLMLNEDATVIMCHSKTKNLALMTKLADILVVAVGKEKMITSEMIKENAVIIDVGINRNQDGKICGDVDFDAVSQKASYITPVPGGVGPMTITMLLHNTVLACKNITEK